MSDKKLQEPPASRAPNNLEKEEARLWRVAMWFVVLLAFGLAALSWERLQSLPYKLGVILPIAVVCVAVSFAAFSYGRRKQVSELKGVMQNLQEQAAPSEAQINQLTQVIARSQRSFKELIDSFDDAAFAISLDGTLRTVNKRFAELLECSYQDIVGHKLDEFLEQPLKKKIEPHLGRFLEKRRWSGLVTLKLKNKPRTLHLDCVLNAIVKDDEVTGVSGLARDVTGERETENRFTELFETLQEGVYFSTPEGKLLDANESLVRMLGYIHKEELLALEANELNFEENQAPVLGRNPNDSGNVRTREITLRRKDGKGALFLDTSRAVWNDAGKIIRYQGTLVDIGEQREMEKELRRQEEFQRYLLESFPDLILVVGLNERFTFVSARIRDTWGYKPDDLMGKKLEETPEHATALRELYQDVSTGRRMFGFTEYGAHHRDGSWRTMRASASPLYDSENKISGVILSIRDITVEKKLEQQVIQSERLAAMGQLVGGFAHELNNPLTSIMGVSELLQETESNDTARKQIALLQQQARRATEIVQNLMYFSRPPAAGKSSIDVSELMQRTIHLHAYSLRKNNITVDFLPEPGLPHVDGDPHQIMQVFLNLVMNSEQAIREVRDRGTLRIRLGKSQGSVLATFQDDGPGIAPDILPKIFDPFYTTKRPGRGTGLGLSICKAILREHGGNVEATSVPVGGALFTVTLPAATAHLAADA